MHEHVDFVFDDCLRSGVFDGCAVHVRVYDRFESVARCVFRDPCGYCACVCIIDHVAEKEIYKALRKSDISKRLYLGFEFI